MNLIKILVADTDQAQTIIDALVSAEEEGVIDFEYTARVTEELDQEQAQRNLFFEEL